LIGVLGAGVWIVLHGLRAGLAAACGGGIAALLTTYAGLKTFGVHSDDPNAVMTNFYRAQVRKFLLAVVLFGVAVQFFGNDFAPLITTFAVSLSVYWFALLWNS
jgi:F0F1-type ATP synthase assembly protein I